MGYQTRKEIFVKIEEKRQKPLITYVTSIRPNLSGQMAGDSIEHIIEQIQLIPLEQEEIDFLLISNGGDPITALRNKLPRCKHSCDSQASTMNCRAGY
jgi:hypothetical protein